MSNPLEEPLAVAADVADEPRTPGWLPALGAALLIGGTVVWFATPRSVEPPREEIRAAASAPAPPQAVQAPTPPARAPGCGAK